MANPSSKSKSHKEILSWTLTILIAVALALSLRTYVFEIVRVDGSSMEPTLHSDQYVFVEKITRYTKGIKRGDIIITKYPNMGDLYVKRVIALPGDTIEVKDGMVYINGVSQKEDYIAAPIDYDMEKLTIPDDSVFVMGDNRNDSLDSHILGPIDSDNIVGHALFVVWPLGEWEMLSDK